jgi:hypothetical protein
MALIDIGCFGERADTPLIRRERGRETADRGRELAEHRRDPVGGVVTCGLSRSSEARRSLVVSAAMTRDDGGRDQYRAASASTPNQHGVWAA